MAWRVTHSALRVPPTLLHNNIFFNMFSAKAASVLNIIQCASDSVLKEKQAFTTHTIHCAHAH